jgi:hypothetical protein
MASAWSPSSARVSQQTRDEMDRPKHHKDFLKTFESIGWHHGRHERFADFLELATCAIRKTTVPVGPEADAFEERYMKVVARYPPDDIRLMPKLLALTQVAIGEGGCDFLGEIASQLELLDARLGQLITPYPLTRLIAEMTLADARDVIAKRGFVTLQEPASGAGGMLMAAADVLTTQGFDPAYTLYVEAQDVASLCFKMTYLQLSLRAIPATVRQANTLSLETFEAAHTPALLPFLLKHGEAFRRWRNDASIASISAPSSSAVAQGDLFGDLAPSTPTRRGPRGKKADPTP